MARTKFFKQGTGGESEADRKRREKGRKRGMLKGLSFDEVSFVGKGANQGAHVSIIKMEGDPQEVAKIMFFDALAQIEMDEEARRFARELYTVNEAFERSVNSILFSAEYPDKKAALRENLIQFVQTFTAMVNDTDVIKSMKGLELSLIGKTQKKEENVSMKKGPEYYMAMAVMTDIQKGLFLALDEAGQTALVKSAVVEEDVNMEVISKALVVPEAKKKEVKKGDDETFEMDGHTISKSEVGAASFAILKSQSARIAKAEAATKEAQDIAKSERDQRILKEMGDAAAKRWPNLPGTPLQKGANLQAIMAMPEDLQKSQLAMLDSGNAANGNLFKEAGGTFTPESSDANDQLNNLAKKYATDNKVTFHKAYSDVLDTPEGKKLYDQTLN